MEVSLPTVVITADDFGFNPSVNEAIVRSLREGLVTHTSLLVNLEGFGDACEAVRRNGLQNRIGLHFNLTEGTPLTAEMRHCPKFCIDGRFAPVQHFARYAALAPDERHAVEREAYAQVAAARAQGLPLTHLDSHNDVHIEPAIAAVVVAVAKASGITRVRPSRNCGPQQGAIRWLQHRSYNAWLGRQGLRVARYFGTVEDMLWLADRGRLRENVAVEVMTHPRLRSDGTVLDAPSMEPLSARVLQLQPHLRAAGAPTVQPV
jgi:predicted glycoside hydrolase/deacetylase ChbG (UPF0249 family)